MQIKILNKIDSAKFVLYLIGKAPVGLEWDGFSHIQIRKYSEFFSILIRRPVTDFIKEFPELNFLYYQIVLIDDNPDLAIISYH